MKIFSFLLKPPVLIGVGGVVVGLILALGFSKGLAYTNSTEFCISCHEMQSTVYQEYKETEHFQNHSGVQTQCADCHVPKEFFPKMGRKVMAVNDLYHHLLGTIDTQEKFEAKRGHLAQRVWHYMEETDSRECRSCHSWSAMELEAQGRSAKRKHLRAQKKGETCIDCHKGIAHELPIDDEI